MSAFLQPKLPFAPHGLVKTELGLSLEEVIAKRPKQQVHQILHSGQHGERHFLLLGCQWSLEAKEEAWHLIEERQAPQKADRSHGDLSRCLDELHQSWIRHQPEQLKCGLLINYEAGWNQEQADVPPKKTPEPELIVFCPKEIIEVSPDGCFSFRDQQQTSLLEPHAHQSTNDFAKGVRIQAEEDRETYLDKARSVIEHIRNGDSFQVNLSQSFSTHGAIDSHSWTQHALQSQGSFFSGSFQWRDFSILSLSPERLLKQEAGGKLITRPIAGTLPRRDNEEPSDLLEFKNNAKELAEHHMLIDLERNDLGRVCTVGSVEVEEYLCIETLPHVHHLVSQVSGQKSPEHGVGTCIFATFPGGTITGCPKVETMQILNRLESSPRSSYTGSMGYLSPKTFDTNILIRSALIRPHEVVMRFGGGIVWDSDPEKEYLETLAKARGLIRSLQEGGAQIDPDHRSLRQFFS